MQKKIAVAKSHDNEKYALLSQGASYLQNFTTDSNEVGKLKTGSAIWGHSPIQRNNTNAERWQLKSCLRVVFEDVQSLVKLVQTMNKNIILENR